MMKAEPKSFASLSPSLLARKGQARPAMRPQMVRAEKPRLDDLGWDDMGLDIAPPIPAPPTAIAPDVVVRPAPIAPVAASLKEIETAFTPRPAEAETVRTETPARAEPGSRAKAAFTLRLNGERHLKLRLACAVHHRSAQRIVTEALDAYLASLPDLNESDWVRSALSKS